MDARVEDTRTSPPRSVSPRGPRSLTRPWLLCLDDDQGSRFVYTRLISPAFSTYSTPIDLVLSFVYALTEAILGCVTTPVVWLLTRVGVGSTSPSTSSEQNETTLTPRTVVRRAKVVYEEIERLQRIERPGMAKRTREKETATKKDPRLRERKMVLERQARERETREMEDEVERMAAQQRDDPAGGPKDGSFNDQLEKNAMASSSSSSTGRSSRPASAPSPSVHFDNRTPPGPRLCAPNRGLSPPNPTQQLDRPSTQPRNTPARAPVPISLPVAASPFALRPRPSTPSSTFNAFASGSRSTPSSALDPLLYPSLESHNTPVASSSTPRGNGLASTLAVAPTPVPPGAFLFQKASTVISLPVPIAEPETEPSPPLKPSHPKEAESEPKPYPHVSPPKRKVASPPRLRATPARKAKSKALLGLTPRTSREPTIELEERVGAGGEEEEPKRRGLFVTSDIGKVEEGEEEEEETDLLGRTLKSNGKGKGRARDDEEEEPVDESEPARKMTSTAKRRNKTARPPSPQPPAPPAAPHGQTRVSRPTKPALEPSALLPVASKPRRLAPAAAPSKSKTLLPLSSTMATGRPSRATTSSRTTTTVNTTTTPQPPSLSAPIATAAKRTRPITAATSAAVETQRDDLPPPQPKMRGLRTTSGGRAGGGAVSVRRADGRVMAGREGSKGDV